MQIDNKKLMQLDKVKNLLRNRYIVLLLVFVSFYVELIMIQMHPTDIIVFSSAIKYVMVSLTLLFIGLYQIFK